MVETLEIKVEQIEQSRLQQVDFDNLPFGKVFSDHMFVMEYSDGKWHDPVIKAYGDIQVSPACTALHYGQSIFEGLKAYKGNQGEAFLFRADANIKRMNDSAIRMCMPTIPEDIFMEAMEMLIRLDADWIPETEGAALYLRPFLFGSVDYIGVTAADKYTFIIFTCPVGSYYAEPVKVKVETEYTRAALGGVGAAKTAGNYAASLYPAKLAQEQGYHQLLWTDGKEHKYIEESGTMNVMFVINGTLLTTPLTDTILPGVTRDAVLKLARDWGMPVEERLISVEEVIEAAKQGTLQEAFGTGTAATIAPIKAIGHEGVDYDVPAQTDANFSMRVLKHLNELRKGIAEDKFDWVRKVI